MTPLPEVRCPCCRKLLLRGVCLMVQVVCTRCGHKYRAETTLEHAIALLVSVGRLTESAEYAKSVSHM